MSVVVSVTEAQRSKQPGMRVNLVFCARKSRESGPAILVHLRYEALPDSEFYEVRGRVLSPIRCHALLSGFAARRVPAIRPAGDRARSIVNLGGDQSVLSKLARSYCS